MRITFLKPLRHGLPLAGLALLLAAAAAQAQPGSGGPGPGTPTTPTTPTDVPLDGGASLLLAGGVGYALKRLRQGRQHGLARN